MSETLFVTEGKFDFIVSSERDHLTIDHKTSVSHVKQRLTERKRRGESENLEIKFRQLDCYEVVPEKGI
jgi:hypothetical protein